MFITLLAFGVLTATEATSAIEAPVPPNVRFTCLDGKPLGATYSTAFQDVYQLTQRLRELMIQGANGTLGTTDRGYLQDEISSILSELNRIITQTTFIDVFGTHYNPLQNGLEFQLAYPSQVSPGYLVSEFKFTPMSLQTLGLLAKRNFELNDLRETDNQLLIVPTINGIAIDAPQRSDDTVSSHSSWTSATAWADKINQQIWQTRVKARPETNVKLLNLDLTMFPFSTNKIKINDVTITMDNITGPEKIMDAINNQSNYTGVKASYQTGKPLKLYAEDSRNIAISLGGDAKLAKLFSNQLDKDADNIFRGSVTLLSNDLIDITDPSLIFGATSTITISANKGPGLAGLSVQNTMTSSDGIEICDAAFPQLLKNGVAAHRVAQACQ